MTRGPATPQRIGYPVLGVSWMDSRALAEPEQRMESRRGPCRPSRVVAMAGSGDVAPFLCCLDR